MGSAPAKAEGGAHRDPALEDLRQRYREGELVLFVGAGVSAAAGLPSWSKLVEALLARAAARGAGSDVVDEVKQLLAGNRYVDALTAAASAAGAQDMIAVVKFALDDRTLVADVPAIGKAIAALEPHLRAVLTTNLDHLLERRQTTRHSRGTYGRGQGRGVFGRRDARGDREQR
jgi:NAD-dependent SIR2 family protein deacetylase